MLFRIGSVTENCVFLVGHLKQVRLCREVGRMLVRMPSWEDGVGLPQPVGALLMAAARSLAGTTTARTDREASALTSL